jgi:hypothetical protein
MTTRKRFTLKSILAMSAVTALAVVSAGSASADSAVSKWQQLRTPVWQCPAAFPDSCVPATNGAYNKWVTYDNRGGDSPLDTNTKNRALAVHYVDQTDHAEVFSRASLHLNKPADEITNLSFDVRTRTLQGGSPRLNMHLSAPLADGSNYVFISNQCAVQIGTTAWSRVDATGDGAGCTINTQNGKEYSSSATYSAWDAFAIDNPGAVVDYDYMVFDVFGNYRLDRVSLGTGYMFTSSNKTAVTCTTEASC